MSRDPFALIDTALADAGYAPAFIKFWQGHWAFCLKVDSQWKKVWYSESEQRVHVYERRFLVYREVATLPVENEEQAACVVSLILGEDKRKSFEQLK